MLRVRQIIPTLSYSHLRDQGIIPDMDCMFDSPTKRYPKWVYRCNKEGRVDCFSYMGWFYEYMVRKMISHSVPVHWGIESIVGRIDELMETDPEQVAKYADILSRYTDEKVEWKSLVWDVFQLCGLHGPGPLPVTKEEVYTLFGKLGALNKMIGGFGNCAEANISYNVELEHLTIQGHPDIISDEWVIDVKCCTSFKSMAEESLLQVLSYAALARAMGRTVDFVGIFLPMQHELPMFQIIDWDHKPFLQKLLDEVDSINAQGTDNTNSIQMGILNHNITPILARIGPNLIPVAGSERMGHHIEKIKGSFYQSVVNFMSERPADNQYYPYPRACQMYLQPSQNWSTARVNPNDVAECNSLVTGMGMKMFSHTPLMINLCFPHTLRSKDNPDFNLLLNDLEICSSLGGSGCVVHVGKRKNMGVTKALLVMEREIRNVLDAATVDCPLLLETPAGQGTEVLLSPEDFGNFYLRFSQEERTRFRLCVDTAHVFGAGYWPMKFINKLVEICGIEAIGLIHFNDSKVHRGSCKDRHEIPGLGKIGYEHMMLVTFFCHEHNIPFVQE